MRLVPLASTHLPEHVLDILLGHQKARAGNNLGEYPTQAQSEFTKNMHQVCYESFGLHVVAAGSTRLHKRSVPRTVRKVRKYILHRNAVGLTNLHLAFSVSKLLQCKGFPDLLQNLEVK